MKKRLINIVKYLIFFAVGIFIFWYVYKDLPFDKLKEGIKSINYFWIFLSLIFGLLALLSRAIRWNMLIKPLGYNPKWYNSFLAVMVLYLANLIVPRAGEVVRCTVVTKYEKVPFTKLVGTVFVERFADIIMLFILAVFIILSQLGIFTAFLDKNPDFGQKLTELMTLKNGIIGFLTLGIIVFLFILFRRLFRNSILFKKLHHLKENLLEGIKSIMKLKNKWYFIGHTMFIFLMWLLMLYVVFLAYKPTAHLSIWTGMLTFLMGGLAMLMPVQGGIGPWHFMVSQTLIIYGIGENDALIFAFIAHTATNLIYLVIGLIALMILPMVNQKEKEIIPANQ